MSGEKIENVRNTGGKTYSLYLIRCLNFMSFKKMNYLLHSSILKDVIIESFENTKSKSLR